MKIANGVRIAQNWGFILLAVLLILWGVSLLGLAISGVILGILAIAAGVLILIGR